VNIQLLFLSTIAPSIILVVVAALCLLFMLVGHFDNSVPYPRAFTGPFLVPLIGVVVGFGKSLEPDLRANRTPVTSMLSPFANCSGSYKEGEQFRTRRNQGEIRRIKHG
jgi:hypothetical protein